MPRNPFKTDGKDAKELLLADLKYFGDSFWKNEEIGEKRVTFFISLATVVLGFLGAMPKTDSSPSDIVNIFALVVLLTIGIVTLFRIIKRNAVTDEIKSKMDSIRDIFKKHFDKGRCLVNYHPFGKTQDNSRQGGRGLRKFGGLAHTVAALNSLIATALVGVILWPRKEVVNCGDLRIFIIGLMVFITTYTIQHYYIKNMDQISKQVLRGDPSQSSTEA